MNLSVLFHTEINKYENIDETSEATECHTVTLLFEEVNERITGHYRCKMIHKNIRIVDPPAFYLFGGQSNVFMSFKTEIVLVHNLIHISHVLVFGQMMKPPKVIFSIEEKRF